MKRILKSLGFGIVASAVVGIIAYLLVTLFNWLLSLAPNVAPIIVVSFFGIVIFGGMAYQDLFKKE